MELKFEKRMPRIAGVRLCEEEYSQVLKLAKDHDESMSATCRALICGALKEVDKSLRDDENVG